MELITGVVFYKVTAAATLLSEQNFEVSSNLTRQWQHIDYDQSTPASLCIE